MDVPTILVTIFSAASELIKHCKEAKQCNREAVRLQLRIHNLVGTLEGAAGAFSGDAAFQKKLVGLQDFLSGLSPLLAKTKEPSKLKDRAMQVAKASTLAQQLQREEAVLTTMCDDLGLAMLPSIGNKLKSLPRDVESLVSKAVEGRVAVALENTLAEQEQRTDQMLKSIISTYTAQMLCAKDRSPSSSAAAPTEGRPSGSDRATPVVRGDSRAPAGFPLCKVHLKECVLRTTKKEASGGKL